MTTTPMQITKALGEITEQLKLIVENTKTESINEQAATEINDLKQVVRNFGMELQHNLDNPPANGFEMARRMRDLAARMSSFGIPPMFQR